MEHDDDEEGGGEDDFDDEDVHPSVAWLYPATSTTTVSSSGREHKRRKPSRRTLCVDYGTRRVGLAIGVGISPRTVPGVTNRGSDLEVARQVLVRARGEGIRDIVVGLPLERQASTTVLTLVSYTVVAADVHVCVAFSLKSWGGVSQSKVAQAWCLFSAYLKGPTLYFEVLLLLGWHVDFAAAHEGTAGRVHRHDDTVRNTRKLSTPITMRPVAPLATRLVPCVA